MKKILAAVMLSVVALAGCSSEEPSSRVSDAVNEDFTPRPPDDQSAVEQEFVYDIQSNGMTGQLGPVPQQDVIELGYVVCDALDNGLAPDEAVEAIVSAGTVNRTDAILIVASATVNLCPEYGPGSST